MSDQQPATDRYANENAHLWTDTDHPFSEDKKRDAFKSPYTTESKHNGRPFTILGLSDREKFDMHNVGPYYRIRFEDGDREVIDADPIEIYENVGTVGGRPW
jgi:hypothetical protein